MARLADGDGSAFHPAFAILWPALRSFAAARLPLADAEDAAQEALMKVFAQAARYDGRDALTWALAIAGYEVLTARRRCARLAGLAQPDEGLADLAPSPEELTIPRDLGAAAAA